MLVYFAVLNPIFGFVGVGLFPLLLGFASEDAVGGIMSLGALGMVMGSVIMSSRKGPKRLVRGLLIAVFPAGVGLILMGLHPSMTFVTAAAFLAFAAMPFGNSFSQALWQRKVDPDVQGRVFAVRRTLGQIMGPVALTAAGPLLDLVFEPALADGGSLAGTVGSVIGTGPGRGAAFMMILVGAAAMLASVAA